MLWGGSGVANDVIDLTVSVAWLIDWSNGDFTYYKQSVIGGLIVWAEQALEKQLLNEQSQRLRQHHADLMTTAERLRAHMPVRFQFPSMLLSIKEKLDLLMFKIIRDECLFYTSFLKQGR